MIVLMNSGLYNKPSDIKQSYGRAYVLTGKVVGLAKHREKGTPAQKSDELILTEGLGIEDNAIQGGDRQVCLFSSEAREWMQAQEEKGLCFRRFQENILTEGLKLDSLESGDVLNVGETVLEITEGKHCFDECPLHSNKKTCRLSEDACFAIVKKGGTIKLGDEADATNRVNK